MKKKIIKITEQDLKDMVSESVKRVLKEGSDYSVSDEEVQSAAMDAIQGGDKKYLFDLIKGHIYYSPYANGYYYKPGHNELECDFGNDVYITVEFDLVPNASFYDDSGDYYNPPYSYVEDNPMVEYIKVTYYDEYGKSHTIEDDGTLKEFFENDVRGCIDYSDYEPPTNEPEWDD